MPSATATLFLNVSAIQELCQGTGVINGPSAPISSDGIIGDFYINTSTYIIYGPKDESIVWQTTASLIGPAGSSSTSTSNYSAVSGFFFNPTAGFFTASALAISNSTTTGLVINSTASQNCIDVETTGSTVATFAAAGAGLLTIDKVNTSMSANVLTFGGSATFTDSVLIPLLGSGRLLNIADTLAISAGKVVFGDSDVISDPSIANYKYVFLGGSIVAETNLFAVVTGSPTNVAGFVVSPNSVASKAAFNIPTSQIFSVSGFTPAVTVNGSISTNEFIACSSIKLPAISAAGNPTTTNIPHNHFAMWYNTSNTTLCAAFNQNGVIKAVPFTTV